MERAGEDWHLPPRNSLTQSWAATDGQKVLIPREDSRAGNSYRLERQQSGAASLAVSHVFLVMLVYTPQHCLL